jgi:superfamily II DNA helicase RecQ
VSYTDIERFKMDEHIQDNLVFHLRHMYNDEGASFRNINQMFAVYSILSNVNDTFIIWPTASGKTLTYLLPCYIETHQQRNGVTVIITPLRELDNQIVSICSHFNIPCTKYTSQNRELPTSGLLLIAMDDTNSGDVAIYLKTLEQRQILKRIVFDEFHLFHSWGSFRKSIQDIQEYSQFEVPLIFLSATCRKETIQKTVAMMRLGNNALIIQEDTIKKNIKFTVEHVENEGSLDDIYAAIKTICDNVDNQKVIIFCITQNEAINVFSYLRDRSIRVVLVNLNLYIRNEHIGN